MTLPELVEVRRTLARLRDALLEHADKNAA